MVIYISILANPNNIQIRSGHLDVRKKIYSVLMVRIVGLGHHRVEVVLVEQIC